MFLGPFYVNNIAKGIEMMWCGGQKLGPAGRRTKSCVDANLRLHLA